MDRRGDHVVARLAHVHVVVGMNLLTRARCQCRNHLVGVHVGRSARACLEDVDRELVVVLALGNRERRAFDRPGLLCIEQAEVQVDPGRRGLDQSQSADKRTRECVSGNREVLDGALRLRSVQSTLRYANFTHGILLNSVVHQAPRIIVFSSTTRCRTSKMNLVNPWKIRLCPHANGYFNRFHLHRGKGRWRTRKGAERRKETRSPLPPCSPGDDTSGVLEDVDTYMLAYMHAYDANNNSPGPGFVIGSQTAGPLKRHDRDGNNSRSSRSLCGQEALGPDPLLRGHRKKRTPVRLQGCGSHPESQCRSPKGLVDGDPG